MKAGRWLIAALTAVAALVLVAPGAGAQQGQGGPPPLPAGATVVAGGLANPRGFTWGPDGALYVAEPGTPPPGFMPSEGDPDEDAPPVINMNGRIERIGRDGTHSVVAGGLPVSVGGDGSTIGVSSVAFVGTTLYAIISAGPVQGHPEFPGGLYRVADGRVTLVANTDAYALAHPPAFIPEDDLISNPYDMIALDGLIYATDGNRSVVWEIDPASGSIRYLADLSVGHPVLTGIAAGPEGDLYVTNLTSFPYPRGSATVWRISRQGAVREVAGGLTQATGIAVAPSGAIYAAEFASSPGSPPFVEPPGRVVALGPGGPTTLAAPLLFPTMLRWGPDGLYAAIFGIGSDAGTGSIVRLATPPGQAPPTAQTPPLTVQRPSVTLAAAQAMIAAAEVKAREIGVPMVIVVVDESGVLKAFARMDGAILLSVGLAQDKAYTAAAFGAPTDTIYDALKAQPALLLSLAAVPHFTLVGGGFPIMQGSSVAGAIGVSGGETEQDMLVAQAGLAALAFAP